MAKRSRALVLELVADSKKFQKGAQGWEKAAFKVAAAIGAAFSIRAVKDFTTDSIRAASDLAESFNALEVTTGSASSGIRDFSRNAAQDFGLTESALLDAATAFSGFADQLGGGADVYEEYLGRARDFASVHNIEVADAMTKFQAGLAGQTEPLRRYGIDLSAAAVASFAYATGIAEAGAELTETEKVQARYGLLMESTDKLSGDFKNTQDDLANATRTLAGEWEALQVILGSLAVDEAADGVSLLTDRLVAWQQNVVISRSSWAAFQRGAAEFGHAVGIASDEMVDMRRSQENLSEALEYAYIRLKDGAGATYTFSEALQFLTADGDFTEQQVRDLASVFGLSRDELIRASNATRVYTSEGVLMEDQTVRVQSAISVLTDITVTSTDALRGNRDELQLWAETSRRSTEKAREGWQLLTDAEVKNLDIFGLLRYEQGRWLAELRDLWATPQRRIDAYNQAIRDQIELLKILGGLASGQSGIQIGPLSLPTLPPAPGPAIGGYSRSIAPGTFGAASAAGGLSVATSSAPIIQINTGIGDPVAIGDAVIEAIREYEAVRGRGWREPQTYMLAS